MRQAAVVVGRSSTVLHLPRRIPYTERIGFANLRTYGHSGKTPMRRVLPIICCTAALGGVLLLWPAAAIPQAKDKLPKVEPHTHKSYVEKIDDGVEFEMLPIPGGSYLIGSANPKADESEKPQRPVSVKPF
ncbi:MAG: hypothetical protein U0744_04315 [Gemmataceae bacterium]